MNSLTNMLMGGRGYILWVKLVRSVDMIFWPWNEHRDSEIRGANKSGDPGAQAELPTLRLGQNKTVCVYMEAMN